jgi:hypothetical protein
MGIFIFSLSIIFAISTVIMILLKLVFNKNLYLKNTGNYYGDKLHNRPISILLLVTSLIIFLGVVHFFKLESYEYSTKFKIIGTISFVLIDIFLLRILKRMYN